MAPAPGGPVCHQVQQQTEFILLVPDPQEWVVDALRFSEAEAARIEAPSMRQSGPFLQSGASVIRWTSGRQL